MSDTRVSVVLNGVDLTTVTNLAARMDADPGYAKDMSQFSRSVRVRWLDGFHSQAYTRDVPPHGYDEPEWLGGKNRAMAASEAVLGAVGGCIAVGFAAQASLREVTVHELEVAVEGTIDLPTFFGIREGNSGYQRLRVTLYVRCDAEGPLLDEIAYRAVNLSPVVNTVRHPVQVDYEVKPIQ
ncbi:MAG: OsmC family protein [Bacillati bacterium ANGP1]|uniref:OsmC family protein n=1 Tax=Candidatus Segetimicrobium genomatis TaxID=2569760 RepID=A0A537JTK9_9BACT|nr:MAG: OsmC family protein [Terrabacteria group bacterium ANGP1]